MDTIDYKKSHELMQSMPAPPDYAAPLIPSGMVLLPCGATGSAYWPSMDANGDWKEGFQVYIQKGSLKDNIAPVICIVADENPEITQRRVDEACSKLVKGHGTLVNYQLGGTLPKPEAE